MVRRDRLKLRVGLKLSEHTSTGRRMEGGGKYGGAGGNQRQGWLLKMRNSVEGVDE